MNKPYKYTIRCTRTGEIQETNDYPLTHQLETWEPTNDPNVFERKLTKIAYVDTRYPAKIRLYNYLTYTKKGLEIPSYKPFAEYRKLGLPILNF